jgi:hypothetical protein
MVPRAGRHLASRTARLGEPAEQAQTPAAARSRLRPPGPLQASQLRHLEQNPNARLCAVLCAEGANQQSVQINRGSARGYQELFASLAAAQTRLQSRWPGHQGRIFIRDWSGLSTADYATTVYLGTGSWWSGRILVEVTLGVGLC